MKRNLLVALLLLIIVLESIYFCRRWNESGELIAGSPLPMPFEHRNTLRVKDATIPSNAIDIPIAPPEDFSGKTRSEILTIRRKAVANYPDLIDGKYEPYGPSFDGIEDGKPWWGNDGLFFFSAGRKGTAGTSERSTIVLNPYLLVDAQFTKVPFIKIHDLHFVDFYEAKFSDPDFAYFPKLARLKWFPKEGRAELTYAFSNFLKFVKRHAHRDFSAEELNMDFRALNARDWGYDYLYLDIEHSVNVSLEERKPAAMRIRDYLHKGGSCNYPGGCNNISPHQSEISDVRVSATPATAHILLWKVLPSKIEAAPDFSYDVHFE